MYLAVPGEHKSPGSRGLPDPLQGGGGLAPAVQVVQVVVPPARLNRVPTHCPVAQTGHFGREILRSHVRQLVAKGVGLVGRPRPLVLRAALGHVPGHLGLVGSQGSPAWEKVLQTADRYFLADLLTYTCQV